MRRKAVRRMVAHRTQSIFDRYHMVDEHNIHEAGRKLAAVRNGET